jgi:hypothetical protein
MSSSAPAPERAADSPEASVTIRRTGVLRKAWERWRKIAHSIGTVQTRLLLIAFYFVVVCPLGLAMRLSGDRLHLKLTSQSHWSPHPYEKASVETARRQF